MKTMVHGECIAFKRWFQRKLDDGEVTLAKHYYKEPKTTGAASCYTISSGSEISLYFPEETSSQSNASVNILTRGGTGYPPRQPEPAKKGKKKAVEAPAVEESQPEEAVQPPKPASKLNYNILSHLKKLPSQISIFDALIMSKDIRDSLIYALQNSEQCQALFAPKDKKTWADIAEEDKGEVDHITFTDENKLLGDRPHERPLYMIAQIDEVLINRIMIDPGSSLNLMTVRTLKALSLSIKHLHKGKTSIRGFNASTQASLGTITLPVCMGPLDSEATFHVIDVDTSYKVLLGRPWLHQYEIIPSTVHQCIKFRLNDQEHTVYGDKHPFKSYESHYTDAVYFMDDRHKKKSSKPEKTARSPLIPHFGSDSEEDFPQLSKAKHLGRSSSSSGSSVKFVGTITHQATDDTLSAILTPRHLCKALSSLNLCSVEELKTFIVPAKK
nr:retropepsin-like domain-containing protein [Serratia marcescens]